MTKEGLRDKRVQILGARHEDAQWFCKCEEPKVPTKKGRPTDRRLWPANQRWTKKHVPTESDPRMKNPAPIEEVEDAFDPWKEAGGS